MSRKGGSPMPEDRIAVEPFEIPCRWPRIGGLAFDNEGAAAVLLAWDREADCLYATQCYGARGAGAVVDAAALRPWGASLPWAWRADEPQAELYRRQGLKLLAEPAVAGDGSRELTDRIASGRFKAFRHLADWFAEFRRRRDGHVAGLIGASCNAAAMRRFGEVGDGWSKRLRYPPAGVV
jgi:hypothetical protein